ncbi:DUF4255 domain-containing protein [Spirulina sp. CS-785/01]|uniref:DUF4255 domain-containing protein n=1 Tax=Spirulina sp. CS-785/01 TaxID=3021716 RepID=UPI00232F4263|nr:DUF4255 domain-containing protein [Spirulina sp. CS-785/01]MDB9314581.1 DUF4255 domain-containing protein [Spirulina sp. CS-785/01]
MSNHLAIATVTATLQRLLQVAIQRDVEGARVTTLRPDAIGTATPQTGVNLYLYQVPFNHIWGNSAEIQRRNRKGEAATKSRTALDMHYMITCYGNDAELEPQRLLGSVIRTLSDHSTLTHAMIETTLVDANLDYLADSTLRDQFEQISFSPLNLSLEDLSKVWSVFFQTPYNLSTAYKATVAMIEGEEAGEKSLPLRDRPSGPVGPYFSQPNITEVINQNGRLQPIESESTILIRGNNLAGFEETLIRIGDLEISPDQVTPTEITLSLAAIPPQNLYAGVQTLQVIHPQGTTNNNGNSQPLQQVVESNIVPFVLRPSIVNCDLLSITGHPEETRQGEIQINSNLTIRPKQRVIISLNEWSTQNPQNYLFEATRHRRNTKTLSFPFQGVKAGDYLIRLHVDGAESKLEVDTNPESDTFNWYISPKLLIV